MTLENEKKIMKDQYNECQIEKHSLIKEKDLFQLRLEKVSLICKQKGVSLDEELRLLKEKSKAEKKEAKEGEGEGESSSEDDEFLETGSVLEKYRNESKRLQNELTESET